MRNIHSNIALTEFAYPLEEEYKYTFIWHGRTKGLAAMNLSLGTKQMIFLNSLFSSELVDPVIIRQYHAVHNQLMNPYFEQ